MGYATILDIAGSILIGAMLLGIILKLNNTASWSIYSNAGELNCQTNLTSMSMVLEMILGKSIIVPIILIFRIPLMLFLLLILLL